jgi:hypothetical protein
MYVAHAGGRKDVWGHGSTKGRQGLMHPQQEFSGQFRKIALFELVSG